MTRDELGRVYNILIPCLVDAASWFFELLGPPSLAVPGPKVPIETNLVKMKIT